MNDRAEEWQREEMIRQLVHALKGRGYEDLRVGGLNEFAGRRPAVIHWEDVDQKFTPDIVARKGGMEYLFQVEIAETLQNVGAGEKMALFAAYARHYRKLYCLAVPENCVSTAKRRLFEMQADEYYTHLLVLP